MWSRIKQWLRRLLSGRRRLLRAGRPPQPWLTHQLSLPEDVRLAVVKLDLQAQSVAAIVTRAIEDYVHLSAVLSEPSTQSLALDQALLLDEAEEMLRRLVSQAPIVSALAEIARHRRSDRPARQAAGEAVLRLRDNARALHDATSAAVQCAANNAADTQGLLRESVERLHLLINAQAEVDSLLRDS